ncbi:hypothetical protein QJS10_CPA08g00608 [Acorus calamus]|uniref:Uncharacterized protein n=1 Tax=Acorus calamus TaxID=4465 RepID=A0AAV9EG41_ACOCL|nr:hypothetical protein QJS10_CPA08g00608 [Acorus calamus]
MPPRKNLPSLPPPVTRSALRTALSDPGGLPKDVLRPDGDYPRHDTDETRRDAEVTELHQAMDEMRRENERLRNLLDIPPEQGAGPHHQTPEGGIPSREDLSGMQQLSVNKVRRLELLPDAVVSGAERIAS